LGEVRGRNVDHDDLVRQAEELAEGKKTHDLARLGFVYSYVPQEVKESEYKEEIDLEAKERLKYDIPKYTIEEPKPDPAPWQWEQLDTRR
jgi:hypothetical protein